MEALRGRADVLPPHLLLASPAQSARKLSVEALAGMADVLGVTSGERRKGRWEGRRECEEGGRRKGEEWKQGSSR